MKHLSLLLFALLCVSITNAQFHYNFSIKQEAYMPLINGTSINDTNTWNAENIKVQLGFNFNFNGTTINTFNVSASQLLGDDTVNLSGNNSFIFSGFLFMHAHLHDRADTGLATMKSVSPLRYLLEGQAPNRIFKFEMFNAGFFDEYDMYGTSNDSLNMQIWFYEQGAIEFRYGPSKISHFNEYFDQSFLLTYMDSLDGTDGSIKMLYFLYGDQQNPSIDSSNDYNSMGRLFGYPDNGTVYRYEPKPLNLDEINTLPAFADVYPTVANNWLFITSSSETLKYKIVSIGGIETYVKGDARANARNIVDVSSLPDGVYILYLKGKSGIAMKKIVKQ